jgi:class 3 adenylate cyclase
MPLYMDRHELAGASAADVAAAHMKDLEVQAAYDVQFLTYWFDYERQHAFCMARGPDREAVEAVHRLAHGLIPNQVIEVDPSALERFMGAFVAHPPGEPYVETAFRTILFTDIEGSTSLTQHLGDARAMAVLRRHDEIVTDTVRSHGGSIVKHTGDGIMASFVSVTAGLRSAIEIQRRVRASDPEEAGALRLRVGIAAGEPVTDSGDLFGAAVQLAARLCQRARPGTVLVSGGVNDLAIGKGFEFRRRGTLRLKGFDQPIVTFEVGLPDASHVAEPAGAESSPL